MTEEQATNQFLTKLYNCLENINVACNDNDGYLTGLYLGKAMEMLENVLDVKNDPTA